MSKSKPESKSKPDSNWIKEFYAKHVKPNKYKVVLILLLLLFMLQNFQGAKVRFLFFSFDLPLVFIVFISFILGFFTCKYVPKRPNEKNVKTEKEVGNEKNEE